MHLFGKHFVLWKKVRSTSVLWVFSPVFSLILEMLGRLELDIKVSYLVFILVHVVVIRRKF